MLCDGPWWHHRRGHRLPRDLLTATQSHLSELHCIWTALLLYVWRFPYHKTMHIRPQIYLIPVPNIFDSSSRYRYVELCSTMHWCFKIHIASSPQPTDPQCTAVAPQCTAPQCNAFHNVLVLHNTMHSTKQWIAMLHNAMLFSELVDKSTEPTPQLIMKSNNSGRNCKYFAAAAAPHYQRSSQL